MSNEEDLRPREYPLPGSTPWLNKRAREDTERAIGRISIAFQELEEVLSCLIGLLVSDDAHLGAIITAELSFRKKLGLLCSLYLYRAGVQTTPEPFRALLGKLHKIEERRNTLLHSHWIKSPFCGVLTRYKYTAKPGKGFIHHTEDFQPEHIEAIVTQTQSLAEDLVGHFDHKFPMASIDTIRAALSLSREVTIKKSIAKSERSGSL